MQYKITEYNNNKRSVTATEKFFSLQDFRQRGPEVLGEEFRDIQEENLKVNKEFYQVLQDAQTMGVSQQKLKKIPLNQIKSMIDSFYLSQLLSC